ncbi:MAG: DUF86 domain-containing protein [Nitrospirota bacterium]|nr:DUF86 domain-containing protein [Nitrospirota bacterium]
MRNEGERLLDIQEAITRIEKYSASGRSPFENDELIQSWIVRHLQIIGEAVRALPNHFRDQHPQIPWSNIIGMRNALVHEYFDIDTDIVWTVIERDLPILKQEIENILQES